ncbi:LysR substrate-binding domain-containing protein [Lactiplantibacillus sp. WILCCON 0030]|uniref:LysR substrate-binding domain-containing protein n=1 Tax=Lactiplantibacillus brownii TaxID=3069269 RepID=A0ABU1A7I5_9LACO|nr:LysR substrate-binding domain-containing protein [Lactiplantibacillus brownii]MDQ7936895.1 LysR substrate-binding domain-containing protein [Lactiplantibacillus brownii]
MNTKDLDYFHQLILQKNFSKVATFFNVSQPTITTAIKRLETEFNTKLIIRDRVHNELSPTASGEQLAEHAAIILRQLTIAKQEIHNLTQQQIVLGLPPIIENHYFPQIAAKLAAAELLATIQTVEGGSIALREAVRNGRVDMALLGSVEPLSYQTLLAEEFDRQPFSIFVSREHPLAGRKRLYFSELRHENFVFFNSNFVHNNAFNKLTRRNHFRPNIVFRSNDTHVLMKLIAENVGVGFLTNVVDHYNDNVVRLELLDDEQPEFITSIVYRTSHILTPPQLKLLEILHSALETE